jgi:PadR family transcriptional regulator PadR
VNATDSSKNAACNQAKNTHTEHSSKNHRAPTTQTQTLTYIEVQCILLPMISKELVAASSRGLVLSILSEGPSYGYAIIQRVRELSDEELRWTDGMLYPVLHRLEKEGLIKSEWRESESGRERKYYTLTGPGRKARQQEQNDWLAVHNTMAKLWNIKPASI